MTLAGMLNVGLTLVEGEFVAVSSTTSEAVPAVWTIVMEYVQLVRKDKQAQIEIKSDFDIQQHLVKEVIGYI